MALQWQQISPYEWQAGGLRTFYFIERYGDEDESTTYKLVCNNNGKPVTLASYSTLKDAKRGAETFR